ncbi:MAG: hydrogenase nickel incorporation protein HypB [Phascolarctobacterium sp.]|nr:hydrogenase nickel incorporation protein HypB [Phascolarctobacterium sp.]
MHMLKEDVMLNVHHHNDHIAEHVQEHLAEHGVFAINLMGAPGVGKTTTVENIIKNLHVPSYVVEGDIEGSIDTERLHKQNISAIQINTFGACHLDAPLMHNALHAMPMPEPGILFIENVGNLVCPAEFSIGENIKLLQVSVTDGSDKPYKYPLAFEKADIILLNKVDLLPYLDFDEKFFMDGIRHLNKKAPIFKVCGKTGEGYQEVATWLEEQAQAARK